MTHAHVKWRSAAAALCLLASACLGVARAQASLSAYGVWRGTVGAQEVMVNLKPATCDSSYYYIRHLWGIPLRELVSGAGSWREGVNSEGGPTWTITLATATALAGNWTEAQDQRSLPLRLKKVATGPEKPEDCNSPKFRSTDVIFNAPRLAAKSPEASVATFDGRRYQVLTVPQTEIKALRLPDEPQPVPKFNLYLRHWLQFEVADYFDCQLNITKQRQEHGIDPRPADFSSQYVIEFWNAHLLAVRKNFYHECADVHPFWGIDGYVVWDLDTDKELNPMAWFRGTRVERGWDLPPKLKDLIIRHYAKAAGGDGNECVDAIKASDGYNLFPSDKGMVFRPSLPHVSRACEDDIPVSWSELQPFLDSAGARLVREKILGGVVP